MNLKRNMITLSRDPGNERLMIAQELIELTRRFSKKMGGLRFGGAVANVYNPLDYARIPHEEYLRRYAAGEKTAVFLGMNPGPFGMAQTRFTWACPVFRRARDRRRACRR